MIYIQLLKDTSILENDVVVHRKAGEWLEVQRNVAIRLLIDERARVIDYPALLTEYGEIHYYTWVSPTVNVNHTFQLHHMDGIHAATSENVIYLHDDLESPITILIGLQALQNWHVAIPLHKDYLISDFGSEQEKSKTQSIIRDLRVPAYNPDIIFYRNSDHAKRWLDEYRAQYGTGKMTLEHALIRSLYITKPYHIALPANSIR